ncbi:MAG: endolytic transglycosylase MltG [bacterium]|nr:endolytic transglycosylase MltG [bacterium]
MSGFILGVLIIAFFQLYIPHNIKGPYKIIRINKGMNVSGIASLLEDEGIIKDGLPLKMLVRITASQRKIKFGVYKLSPSQNLVQIFRIIKEGRSGNFSVTIPPGYNIRQIASLLEREGIILGKERFIKLTSDANFISELSINAKKLEGYLFPETYCFEPETDEKRVIEIMVGELKKRVLDCKKYDEQLKFIGLNMNEVLTLASLIEKETGLPEERPLISAVFHNRLKEGMPLESCSTVIYALGERFDGNLKREDLHIPSEYNTYLHKGLPPSPICNPGIKSIEGALYPASVDYLFFVSKGNGTHKFSSDLQEHRENVIRYQIEPNRR